uniref:Neurotransmitter-gated ion-channel ligand-binding domain-containing protein n=1 Tax=Romanomermis culicivorax TaxID=13658 RepID=A0A915KAZ7_ROMCU
MQIRGPCDIDLRAFPFDIQQCFISFETSSYNFQEVELMWFHEPLTLIWRGHLPDFYLHHTRL